MAGVGTGLGVCSGGGNGALPWAARVARLLEATPASETVKTLPPTTSERLIAAPPVVPVGCVIRPTSSIPGARPTRKPTALWGTKIQRAPEKSVICRT